MNIDRAAFAQHLRKISCGGKINEVVFHEGFATAALTEDQQLLVIAPSLPKMEPLAEPTGVSGLDILIKGLGILSGSGEEQDAVDIQMEDHRLVVNEGYRGELRLMTAAPKTIGTRVDPKISEKIQDKAEAQDHLVEIPLTHALVHFAQSMFNLMKAEEVELVFNPDGSKIRVGNQNTHMAEYDLQGVDTDQEYTLLFGDHLIAVLGNITNFSEASITSGGPKNFIGIKDGTYRYILSPRVRGADDEG